MASSTNYYKMAIFDFGDKLDASINVTRESERFTFIDKMLYGLYLIYGLGVINGWEVFDNGFTSANGISIGISSGNGIISYVACDSDTPQIINNLPSNSILYIYAVGTPDVLVNMSVNFITNTSSSLNNSVKLATVTTGTNGIISIDNTTRDFLNFEQIIQTAIDNHKHRGIPTKIDLSSEVKNQLPGAKLENFDANKVTTGKFDNSIIPSLNHSDLLNTGILSHAQLDSLSQIITADNSSLLGEVTTVNFLKQVIYEKLNNYPNIDQYFVNELCIIPGVSDSLIDYQNTTAYVDYINNRFLGIDAPSAISYIFTNNFILTDSISNAILTSTKTLNNGSIVFGINFNNSLNFNNYTILTENKLNSITNNIGKNCRIGAQLITSLSNINIQNPLTTNFTNYISFQFQNLSAFSVNFHFKVDFYTDILHTNLAISEFSLNNQNGWVVGGISVPAAGFTVASGNTITVHYFPNLLNFTTGQTYYIVINVYDGTSFSTSEESITADTFVSDGGSIEPPVTSVPVLNNFVSMFSTINGNQYTLNL